MTRLKRLYLITKPLLIGGLFLLLLYALLFRQKASLPSLPPPTVMVAKPNRVFMADYITQTGNVVAYNTVNLVARIEGYTNPT